MALKPKGAPEYRSEALRMASSDAKPDAEEVGDTCKVALTEEQVGELTNNGMLTVQADSGETIELTMQAPDEAAAPDADAMEAGG